MTCWVRCPLFTQCFSEAGVKWIVFRPCFRFKFPRLSALVPLNTGWPLCANASIIWRACWFHVPSSLLMHVPHHVASFPGPRHDGCPRWNFLALSLTCLAFETHPSDLVLVQSKSLNIDMNTIVPSNVSGFICRASRSVRILMRISIDVNPSKKFDSNSIGSS